MSEVKDWMMEMQEEADYALGEGARTSGEVIYSIHYSDAGSTGFRQDDAGQTAWIDFAAVEF